MLWGLIHYNSEYVSLHYNNAQIIKHSKHQQLY